MPDLDRELNRVYQQLDQTTQEYHQNYVALEEAVTVLLAAGKSKDEARADPKVRDLLAQRSALQDKTTDLSIRKWELLRQIQSAT